MGYISELREIVGHRTIIMPCACLILGDNKGRVLLQKRADDGKWGYHGGAIEIDEAVEDALRREIKEELNIELLDVKLFGIYSGKEYHHVYPNMDETSCIEIVYLCSGYKGLISIQEEELTEVKWFKFEELPAKEDMTDSSYQPIMDYFASLKKR